MPVFPIESRSKAPIGYFCPNGFHDASIIPSVLNGWWSGRPDAGLGISTGPAGLCVIDIDPLNGGSESFHELTTRFGPLESTYCTTPHGGEHIYFKRPPGASITSTTNSFGPEYPGIDIRASGGYVVAPPSIGDNGVAYTWGADCPERMSVLPGWVVERLQRPDKAPLTGDTGAKVVLAAGGRNAGLTSWAGRLRRLGMDEEATTIALLGYNKTYCHPELAEREVRAIAHSVCRYQPSEKLHSGSNDSDELEVIRADEVDDEEVDWLWDARIARGYLTAIVGPPEVGKTYFYSALAAALSVGQKLPGQTRSSLGETLIYAGEDHKTQIRSRLKKCGADLSKVHIMTEEPRRETLMKLDRYISTHDTIKLVVLDPITSFLYGKSENSDTEVRECLEGLRQFAEARMLAVCYLRHLTKFTEDTPFKRILGSGAFGAVPRSVIYLDQNPNTKAKALFNIKNNLSVKGKPIGFNIDDEGFHFGGIDSSLDPDTFAKKLTADASNYWPDRSVKPLAEEEPYESNDELLGYAGLRLG